MNSMKTSIEKSGIEMILVGKFDDSIGNWGRGKGERRERYYSGKEVVGVWGWSWRIIVWIWEFWRDFGLVVCEWGIY